MNLECNICKRMFNEGDEVMFIAYAFWHAIPSRVNFGMTKPHDIDQDSIQHTACKKGYSDD